MKRNIFFIFLLIFFLSSFIFDTSSAAAYQNWFFPMDHYQARQGIKNFARLIDDEFYKGKEKMFPFNRFYGYHAGIDLEIVSGEKNKEVPVYVIGDGKVVYIGRLAGYGGLILVQLTEERLNALYGHVKIANLSIKEGDLVKAGQLLTYLGDAFSHETSKERKHLHFAIYKGTDLYFRGHESSLTSLSKRWLDPTIFLRQKGATDLAQPIITPPSTITPFTPDQGKVYNLFDKLMLLLKRLFLSNE